MKKTLLIPVYQEGSKRYFVDKELGLPISEIRLDGPNDDEIKTTYLKFNTEFNLIGISYTRKLLDTDTTVYVLDPDISIRQIVVQHKLTKAFITIYTNNDFPPVDNSSRKLVLNYTNPQYEIELYGTINIETGDCEINASGVGDYEPIGYLLTAYRIRQDLDSFRYGNIAAPIIKEINEDNVASIFQSAAGIETIYQDDFDTKVFHDDTDHPSGVRYVIESSPERVKLFRSFVQFQKGNPYALGPNGITNEHLIAILIHRIKLLDSQVSSDKNKEALHYLKGALAALESRTKDRVDRGVQGQQVS